MSESQVSPRIQTLSYSCRLVRTSLSLSQRTSRRVGIRLSTRGTGNKARFHDHFGTYSQCIVGSAAAMARTLAM